MVNRILTLAAICLMGLNLNSQMITPHFLTIKQGISLAPAKQNTHLLMGMEYFESPMWSVVSENSILLTSKSNAEPLKYDLEISLGGNTHKLVNQFDFYIGMQPGLRALQGKEDGLKPSFAPMLNITSGINYYSKYYFHLFMQAKYTTSNALSAGISPTSEFRFSFGLGYNLSQIYRALKK